MSIRSILCPVDFSPTSEDALRYAVSLASQLGVGEVHLLHVQQTPAVVLPDGSTVVATGLPDVRQHASRELESLAKRYSAHGTAVVPHLAEGLPYRVIAEQAEALGVNLVGDRHPRPNGGQARPARLGGGARGPLQPCARLHRARLSRERRSRRALVAWRHHDAARDRCSNGRGQASSGLVREPPEQAAPRRFDGAIDEGRRSRPSGLSSRVAVSRTR